jgi:hypothetical protein
VRSGNIRVLSANGNGVRTAGPEIKQAVVWLRSIWGFDGVSQFSYSLDGANFVPIGGPYQLTWGNYRGDRIGLFTVNPIFPVHLKTAGWIDIDSVHYEVAH